jgi:DNA polymerase
MGLKRLHADAETFSELDLTAVGAYRYAEHESTELLCLGYGWEHGPIELWLPGMPVPEAFYEADEICAWNAQFEYAVLSKIWPGVIPKRKWRCTMTLALSYGFPGSLDMCATALGIPGKDLAGRRSMLKLSKPRKPTKKDLSTRWTKDNAPADFPLLYAYNKVDVSVERRVHQLMPTPALSEREQRLYEIDFDANEYGVAVDIPTVRIIKRNVDRRAKELLDIAHAITGGLKMTQREKLHEWLAANGMPLPDLKGITVENKLKETEGIVSPARRVLEIRNYTTQSSLAKLSTMLDSVCRDGRIKGLIQFLGAARTGRWAGRLVQVQNFPKGIPGLKTYEMVECSELLNVDTLDLIYGDAFYVYSSYLRSMLTATKGYVLCSADYSAIEARITAWFAREGWLIEYFASGGDPYCVQATDVFGRPITKANEFERFVGKQLVLGCGFGMGWEKFVAHCFNLGVTVSAELAERAVESYRARNKRIVDFWYSIESSCRKALKNPGVIVQHSYDRRGGPGCGIAFKYDGRNWMQIRLLSGRLLSYYKPHMSHYDEVQYMGVDQRTKDWGPQKTWGGKLVENIVQATARDIMAAAIMRLDEQYPEFRYLTSVHDEVIAEALPEHADAKRFGAIIAELPEWAKGLPAKCDAWSGFRYRKAA